ncbi:hypothetical protein V6N13_009629 [Hibiscus sabdariffa]|uniref:F-box domain-containing protein n=1 Tax=Hibiscus sabdariffa TaxID=183260 RepID=A0ABR2B467_9ROSI
MEVLELDMLPESCVSVILSLTSPSDACKSSLVSTTFRSAAGSIRSGASSCRLITMKLCVTKVYSFGQRRSFISTSATLVLLLMAKWLVSDQPERKAYEFGNVLFVSDNLFHGNAEFEIREMEWKIFIHFVSKGAFYYMQP